LNQSSKPAEGKSGRPLLSIIIPIYNEAELLPTVLERVRAMEYSPKELVLVDDFSTDGTRDILKEEEAKSGTTVLYHEINRGKGSAIRTGLKSVHGDIVIVQDADMEYDPDDIPRVLEPILTGEVPVSYGSRFMGDIRNMRIPNRVANWILAWTVSLLYGQKITDEATAYKAFRREVIDDIQLNCQRFEFCPEVTAKVLRKGHRIAEVPVSFVARTFEEGKKIGYRDFITAMRILLKHRFIQ
jgi:glycosyltransferase involved in cell wall biosynthesis